MTLARRLRPRLSGEAAHARARLRAGLWPATQAAAAAALSWYIARDVLGHSQPFFAPVAALIAIGTSSVQRGYRSVQLVSGVLLGIGIGEAFTGLLGVGPVTIGVVALVTLATALLLGVGFFGQGMMFVNQSGVSALLVVALHRSGAGGERLLDALVGGAVALFVGVGLFPVEPVRLIRDAERDVLSSLAAAMTELAGLLDRAAPADQEWLLETGRDVTQALSTLAQARRDARTATYVAPRRWASRSAVQRETTRTHAVELLANTTITLLRVATDAQEHGEAIAPDLLAGIARFTRSLTELAQTPQPWTAPFTATFTEDVAAAIAAIEPHSATHAPLVASLTREAERDLLLLLPPAHEPAGPSSRPASQTRSAGRIT